MGKNIYTDGTYLVNNPTWDSEDSPWKGNNIIKMLNKHSLSFSSYIEVGCGAGKILHVLSKHYPFAKFHGYDISPQAIQMAKKYEGSNLEFFCDEIVNNNLFYDVAAFIDVVEHIENYIQFLRDVRNLANNFIFVVPLDISVSSVLRNTLCRDRHRTGHLHYFMKDTVLETLHDAGYSVVDYFYAKAALEHITKTRHMIAYLPRKILYSINQDLCVRVFGGFPLIVLAKVARA